MRQKHQMSDDTHFRHLLQGKKIDGFTTKFKDGEKI